MVNRSIPRIYHLRSRSEEVCHFDKRGVDQNSKLPMTETEGGIYRINHGSYMYVIYYSDDVTQVVYQGV